MISNDEEKVIYDWFYFCILLPHAQIFETSLPGVFKVGIVMLTFYY